MRNSLQEGIYIAQEFLASKMSAWISTFASGVGIASFAGIVSFWAGVLSVIWLSVQLFNYFSFTYPKNLRERERDLAEKESTLSPNPGDSSHGPLDRRRSG